MTTGYFRFAKTFNETCKDPQTPDRALQWMHQRGALALAPPWLAGRRLKFPHAPPSGPLLQPIAEAPGENVSSFLFSFFKGVFLCFSCDGFYLGT